MEHGEITKEMAEYLLDQDLSDSIADARTLIPPTTWSALSVNQRAVVVEMVFNMGVGKVTEFRHFLMALNEGNYQEAVNQLIDSKWYRDVTHDRAVRLVKKFQEA